MLANVFSKSANSLSTTLFVSSALFTAWASNASIALICLSTSYVAGLKAAKLFSISSTTEVFLRLAR
jgi:hypothetical protein